MSSCPPRSYPHRIKINETGNIILEEGSVEAAAPFAAPEILNDDKPSESSIVYSIGAIHFRLLAGRPPVGDAWRLKEECPGIPESLRTVILHSLEYRPESRYQNLSQLKQAQVDVLNPKDWWEKQIQKSPLDPQSRERFLAAARWFQGIRREVRDFLPWQYIGSILRFFCAYGYRSGISEDIGTSWFYLIPWFSTVSLCILAVLSRGKCRTVEYYSDL